MTNRSEIVPGLVSIVICAYNNWPDLETTIASALHQSFRPLEVIVVDNSSTDATPNEVPRRFGRSVRYLRQTNRECAGAYNAGFDMASGEFIQFVDGDDVLAPNKIAKQLEVFRVDPQLDIVYGDVRQFQTVADVAIWEDVATRPEGDMLMALLLPEKLGAGINVLGSLFRRRVLEKVGRWDESLYVRRPGLIGCERPCDRMPLWPLPRVANGVQTDMAWSKDCKRHRYSSWTGGSME